MQILLNRSRVSGVHAAIPEHDDASRRQVLEFDLLNVLVGALGGDAGLFHNLALVKLGTERDTTAQ